MQFTRLLILEPFLNSDDLVYERSSEVSQYKVQKLLYVTCIKLNGRIQDITTIFMMRVVMNE